MGFPLAAVDPPVTDNRAGQISWHCNTCHNTFDVGVERFHTDAFQQNPLCYWCFVDDKETR